MKTLIAVPCMEQVPTQFMQCLLGLRPAGDAQIALTQSSLIYDARNQLAQKAVREGFDRVLWLDSDMYFTPDLLERLSAVMDQGGKEFVSGLYFSRKWPIRPVIYSQVGIKQPEKEGEAPTPIAVSYENYPRDSLTEIAGAGFGGVLITTKLLRAVLDNYGLPFSPILGFGEDLSFCQRVTALGHTMYCDTSIKLGHIYSSIMTESNYIHDTSTWIDVNDRLPDMATMDVDWMLGIVNGRYGDINYVNAVEMVAYEERNGWWMPAYPEYNHINVTHWMPCPAAPEMVNTVEPNNAEGE